MDDIAIWRRLLDHTITQVREVAVGESKIIFLQASRRTDVTQDWDKLVAEGLNCYIMTVAGETSYLGPQCYKALMEHFTPADEAAMHTNSNLPPAPIELIPLGKKRKVA